MRNLFLFAPLLAAVVFGAADARAQAQLYAGGYGGFGIAHDADTNLGPELSMDLGFGFGAFVGGRLTPNVRLEGEVAYRANDLDSFGANPVGGEVTSLAFMANGYYDFPVQSAVIPYVGAGVGVADVEIDGFRNGDDTVLAIQLMGGAAVPVSPSVALTAEYRLFGTEDPHAGAFRYEYLHSGFLFGVRANF